MNRTTLILIILICATLLGAGAFYCYRYYFGPGSPFQIAQPTTPATSKIMPPVLNANLFSRMVRFNDLTKGKDIWIDPLADNSDWHNLYYLPYGLVLKIPSDWKVSVGQGNTPNEDNLYFAPKSLYQDFAFLLTAKKMPFAQGLKEILERRGAGREHERHINNITITYLERFDSVKNQWISYGEIFGNEQFTFYLFDSASGTNTQESQIYSKVLQSIRLVNE
jgi:hypothetical protein